MLRTLQQDLRNIEALSVGKKLEPSEKAFNFCRMSTRRREPKRKIKMQIMRRWTLICLVLFLSVWIVNLLLQMCQLLLLLISYFLDQKRLPHLYLEAALHQPSYRNLWQFFHSQTSRPMAPEQVFAEEDSEDEVDDEVLDLEYRMRLDRFKDVSQHEKQLMLLWNSFMRKQRVVVDGEDQVTWLLFNT
ncbi:putative polycomb protein, VEFS-Box [Helianthus annuus]|uniref:Polycomb protein, VEFS-Box n=1 Tax=Helianthus annuus TaxID=4232 RepID=A0A251UYI5_HELAN|nr:putative polycomb protein, VEFS-Box [Helianthus annuus]KAJ0931417.1 putative polycomb protein, VEFS-Box [Helianthus annuus]